MYRPLAATITLCLLLLSAPLYARASDAACAKAMLDNGLTVVSQRASGDLAAACLFVNVGPACEDRDNNGITSLLNRMVLACHPLAGSTPPVLKIEQLGGRVTAETSGCYSCFSLVVPVKNLPEALRVLAGAVGHPDCSEAALSTEAAALTARRDWLGDRLAEKAFGVFMDKTYGGLACGLDPSGTAKSLRNIGSGDISRWRATYYQPTNMTLSIAANIGPDQAARAAGLAFKDMASPSAGTAKTCPAPVKGGECGKTASYEDRSADGMAAAVIGYTVPPPDSPDYPALRLAAALLSDGMGSSVFRRLRDSGLSAYSFGSVIPPVAGRSRLAFYVVTDPDKVMPAVSGIKDAVETLRAGDVSDEEISRARGLVLGELSFGGETTLDRAWSAGYYESMGLGSDFPDRLAGLVGKVGRPELTAAADRYLTEYTQVVLKPGKGSR